MVTHPICPKVAQEKLIIALFIPVQRGLSWRIELASIINALVAVFKGGGLSTGLRSRLLVDINVTEGLTANHKSVDKSMNHKTTPTVNGSSLKHKKKKKKKELCSSCVSLKTIKD